MGTEIGKAYVQIVPTTKGMQKSISNQIVPGSKKAGRFAGLGISSMVKKALVTAGIGKALVATIQEGGKLQQSLGGIETLFKNNAGMVKKYANEAYKTTGLSANAYMENVTGFSASLLQSVGGDTKKSAEIANMAMIDMADNSNKMGTSMESIQNAYQGFAKQNYTMLDNLKLGYGGTKTEMQRLLKEATELTGVKYDIDSLSDVYEAIHVIQGELDITGTTAKESAETITGSFSAMKGSFQNVLGALALGEGLTPALEGLATTISTFLFDNLFPMIGTIISQLPSAIFAFWGVMFPKLLEMGGKLLSDIGEGIVTSIPVFLEKINALILSIKTWFTTKLPVFLQSGIDWVIGIADGIFQGLPNVINSMANITLNIFKAISDALPIILKKGYDLIAGLGKGLLNNLPAIVKSINSIMSKLINLIVEKGPGILKEGFNLISKLASGLLNNLPTVIKAIGSILWNIISTLGSHLPSFAKKGLEFVGKLAFGLIKAIPGLVAKIPQIITGMVIALGRGVVKFSNVGGNLIRGLWRGIANVKDWIMSKISGFVDNIVGGIKSFFGIRSPSRVFSEIGEYLNLGLAQGITDNLKPVSGAMDELQAVANRDFESNMRLNLEENNKALAKTYEPSLSAGSDFEGKETLIDDMSRAVYKALTMYKPKLELDNREVARIIGGLI